MGNLHRRISNEEPQTENLKQRISNEAQMVNLKEEALIDLESQNFKPHNLEGFTGCFLASQSAL